MRIKNMRFKGMKQAVIGSCLVDYDDDGVADVTEETAKSVKGLKGFEILPKVEPDPIIKTDPVIEVDPVIEPDPVIETDYVIDTDYEPVFNCVIEEYVPTETEFDFVTPEPLITNTINDSEFAEKPVETIEKPKVTPVKKRTTTKKGRPTKKG